MRQGVKTELKEGKLCGMEDRGRGTLWKGMKKQTRSKQMRSESPEKLPALTGGSEALERGQKLLSSNPPPPSLIKCLRERVSKGFTALSTLKGHLSAKQNLLGVT